MSEAAEYGHESLREAYRIGSYIRACVLAQRAWEHKQDHGTQPNAEQGRQIVAEVDQKIAAHVAEVTEAAVRAAVAADIRAAIYPEWVHQFSATVRETFGSGVAHAARIAEGKQP